MSVSFAPRRDLAFTPLMKGMMEKKEMEGHQKSEWRSASLYERFRLQNSGGAKHVERLFKMHVRMV